MNSMKKILLFLIALVLFSCESKEETETKVSPYASYITEHIVGAYYLRNNHSFYFYTSNYPLKNNKEYNLWEISYDGEKYENIPTGDLLLWGVNCYRQTNAYNTLWTVGNHPHDFDGSLSVKKVGDEYSVTLKTGVLYDSEKLSMPSYTINYTGPIEIVNMLEY